MIIQSILAIKYGLHKRYFKRADVSLETRYVDMCVAAFEKGEKWFYHKELKPECTHEQWTTHPKAYPWVEDSEEGAVIELKKDIVDGMTRMKEKK